jgi:hypothetical protein
MLVTYSQLVPSSDDEKMKVMGLTTGELQDTNSSWLARSVPLEVMIIDGEPMNILFEGL